MPMDEIIEAATHASSAVDALDDLMRELNEALSQCAERGVEVEFNLVETTLPELRVKKLKFSHVAKLLVAAGLFFGCEEAPTKDDVCWSYRPMHAGTLIAHDNMTITAFSFPDPMLEGTFRQVDLATPLPVKKGDCVWADTKENTMRVMPAHWCAYQCADNNTFEARRREPGTVFVQKGNDGPATQEASR